MLLALNMYTNVGYHALNILQAGYTPLHVASHFGQMGMVKLLLSNGAAAGPVTAVNYTPLHQAAQQGHSTIVAALLDAGANPNAVTNVSFFCERVRSQL